MGVAEMDINELISTLRVGQCLNESTTLWNREDCAKYLKFEKSTLDKMISRNEFIEPDIRFSSTGKGDRWYAKSVIQWAQKKQFTVGKPRNSV